MDRADEFVLVWRVDDPPTLEDWVLCTDGRWLHKLPDQWQRASGFPTRAAAEAEAAAQPVGEGDAFIVMTRYEALG